MHRRARCDGAKSSHDQGLDGNQLLVAGKKKYFPPTLVGYLMGGREKWPNLESPWGSSRARGRRLAAGGPAESEMYETRKQPAVQPANSRQMTSRKSTGYSADANQNCIPLHGAKYPRGSKKQYADTGGRTNKGREIERRD